MNNVELVDFKPAARRPEDCGSGEEDEDAHEQEMVMVNSRRWLRGEGWGSPRATTLVLNNLMFMTAKVILFFFFFANMCLETCPKLIILCNFFLDSMVMNLPGQR